jgi:hypothetical protein
VKQLYQRHCQGSGPSSAVDEEVNQEYARQRQYLERTVEGLKRKLAVDVETHRVEGLKVMQQNVALIKEINELRREIKVRTSDRGVVTLWCRLGAYTRVAVCLYQHEDWD